MSTNPIRTASATSDVQNGARQRMLAARDRIRRYFSPEVVAGTNSDDAEVIGQTADLADPRRTGS